MNLKKIADLKKGSHSSNFEPDNNYLDIDIDNKLTPINKATKNDIE